MDTLISPHPRSSVSREDHVERQGYLGRGSSAAPRNHSQLPLPQFPHLDLRERRWLSAQLPLDIPLCGSWGVSGDV